MASKLLVPTSQSVRWFTKIGQVTNTSAQNNRKKVVSLGSYCLLRGSLERQGDSVESRVFI
jgi:hypothetical protein